MRPPFRPCLRGPRRLTGPAAARHVRPPVLLSLCRCRCRGFASSSFFSFSSTTTPPEELPTSPPSPPPSPPNPQGFRAALDLRHIRQNVHLHADNCVRRNYAAAAGHPARIVELFGQLQTRHREGRALREASNALRRQLANVPAARAEAEEAAADEAAERAGTTAERAGTMTGAAAATTTTSLPVLDTDPSEDRPALLHRARLLKQQLAALEADEARLAAEMQRLAAALPNLTSAATPDTKPTVLGYINCDDANQPTEHITTTATATTSTTTTTTAVAPDRWRSHVHIGTELGLLDFAAAATASGWGWYYLLGDGARLEQALVQYALASAHRHGWQLVAPPSVVRRHVAAACGFQPRDQGGEQQTYALEGLPLGLAATAEIPLAALYADTTLDASGDAAVSRPAPPSASASASASPLQFPLRRAAASRCYRAEAGARGARTKGLYRVHEFTKVELFAWTAPDLAAATDTFDELVDMQTEILSSLGLPCRILEMPATDLGASAFRKVDIEAWFPSRGKPGEPEAGWGEVTSASLCTDYQTRRLATRTRIDGGPATFPWTLNGTALAVPRVLAALLENGWDEESMTVAIPECLRPWMDGQTTIGLKHHPVQ